MKEIKALIVITALLIGANLKGQDTFSIVAVDSITGEVGSAGASCVDLSGTQFSADLISELFPGNGVITCQAYYEPANQMNARNRMNMGESPSQIIQWITSNDVGGTPQFRQYGIATIKNGTPLADSYSGDTIPDYYGQILGPNYAIQGNTLLGQSVLDSMEYYFLQTKGNLACKLMAALQGANVVGADARCAPNGTSSLLAWVKVALPNDFFGSPSIRVTVETANGAGIEPIDSLQTKFNSIYNCTALSISDHVKEPNSFLVFPNPSHDFLIIKSETYQNEKNELEIFDMSGRVVNKLTFHDELKINTSHLNQGVYFLKIMSDTHMYSAKFIKN